jgi:GNAT superfamily N-acetyltransferase
MSAAQNEAKINFRMGEERDAAAIARFYNMANNGLSEIWWGKQAKPNETWLDAFIRDIKLQNSIAYYARSVVAEVDGKVAGLLIAFPQEEIPPAEMLSSLPSSELSILELRRLAEGSMFIAVVAVDEKHRGNGIARHFINMSMHVASISNLKEASVIIHESNKEWLDSFLRRGFKERAREKVGDHAFYPQDSSWVLITCPVEAKG